MALLNSPSNSGETPAQEEPNYTVDGIALGMTEAQVRAIWSSLDETEDVELQVRRLRKLEGNVFPPLTRGVTLDKNNKVVEVRGHRLKLGGKLVLSPEHPLSTAEALWNQKAEPEMTSCGRPGFLRTITHRTRDIVFSASAWNLATDEIPSGATIEQMYEQNPEFRDVEIVSIQDREYANAVASLAVLSSPNDSDETPPKETDSSYTVDGISLGMSESEVRALWGELEQTSDGKIRRFGKSGEDLIPPLAHLVTLDEDGRVVAVQGRRLKLEGKLVLACGQEWSGVEDSLGEPTRSNLFVFGCGNPGPLQTERRARGDVIFEVRRWNPDFYDLPPGLTPEQVLEKYPELKGVQSVSIHTRDFYYRNSKTR